MSLADRLDTARRSQAPPQATTSGTTARRRVRDPFADLKGRVHENLIDRLGPRLYDPHLPESELAAQVRSTLQEVMDREETPLSVADRTRIAQEVSDEILGHGPLEPLLRDTEITEIMVNGADSIYIERQGKIHPVEARFTNEAHLRRVIDKIVGRIGRRIDEASPLVDARLPDGSRVNAVIAPVALDGAMLTIRKFSADPFTDRDLIAFGTFSPGVRDFLRACVIGRRNIVISGGTGSGKTTTLNVLSSYLPGDERIITIEDAAELQLHQDHVVRLESRPSNIEGRGEISIRDLVRNALRMRPDRIVVGEVRDGAALDMLQAMNTGHDGSITTVHANSPRDSLARLETMVLMAGVELPVRAIREQVVGALDLIVQQARLKDGSRRIVQITEVVGMEGDVVTLQDLFTFDWGAGRDEAGRYRGQLVSTGIRPKFAQDLVDLGVDLPTTLFTFSSQ
ncbi:CpaF family protein [Nostocoides sp. F2B08]|uniref:CpaF family protein n=1 Tax=Nostocoides sp. F2B08 TaxID=2653936 RepID=UPI001263839B|nr:CpaF family protein [Tetrasphaera sp. F2B08]KAB7741868.1 CpaF family protein [Tetrasphaera sp. F2B08]